MHDKAKTTITLLFKPMASVDPMAFGSGNCGLIRLGIRCVFR